MATNIENSSNPFQRYKLLARLNSIFIQDVSLHLDPMATYIPIANLLNDLNNKYPIEDIL